jgi:O-antigen chain-terminating methyltransferase
VRAAYKVVLGREPDAAGVANYLSALRTGQIGKKQLVAALRFSEEGRRRESRIPGLWWPRTTLAIRRVPIVGYALRVLANIARLPRLAGDIQALDASLAVRFDELTRTGNAVVESVERQTAFVRDALEVRVQDGFAHMQTAFDGKWASVTDEQMALSLALQEMERRIERSIGIEPRLAPANVDRLYADFEEQFRGSRELIKNRQSIYLEHIAAVADPRLAIDIGPGRGEWLELLRDNGWVGIGFDVNPIFVAHNQKRGFDVRLEDAVEGLQRLPEGTFSLVTAFHVIEHLSFFKLLALVDEARRVLRPGGMLILETPNPENLITASCNFYLDPTHRNPVPPALAAFVLTARGFEPPLILRLHGDSDPEWERVSDPSVRRLLSGAQDYAVIARQP